MMNTIKAILTDCQTGHQNQTALIKSLTKIYNSMEMEKFYEEFIRLVKYFLIVFKREPAVERAIDFISKFSTSLQTSASGEEKDSEKSNSSAAEQDMHPFLLKLFRFLLQNHKAQDKSVRFRCCHLINKLLCDMGEDALIDDELYDKIYESMLIRLRDKFAVVRAHAVLALARLQNPADRDCPIIKAYLFMLGCDQNFAVRRAVLSSIAASAKTLSSILERTQDAEPSVRRLAYQILAEKVHIRALTIAQRVKILHQGLNDRTESVREACTSRLLQAWLRTFSGNALELLNCLDVENSAEICQQMLVILFKKASTADLASSLDVLSEEIFIPLDKLTCENAFYWRCLCEHIRSLGTAEEEHLDKILPSGVVFAQYLRRVVNNMKTETQLEVQLRHDFILQQLLSLVTVLDLSDIVARKAVDKLMRDLLLEESISHSLVKSLLSPYLQLHLDNDMCLTSIAEIISDIREPMTVVESQVSREDKRQLDLKLAAVRVELNQLRDELDDSVQRQEFAKAAELKERITSLESTRQSILEESAPKPSEVRVEKSDSQTLIKCLSIVCETLSYIRFKKLNATLQSLLETLVLPGIQNTDPAVRNLAVRALGLCCLRSSDTARDYLLLLLQVSRVDVEVVQVTAVQALFDLLHFFGLKEFNIEAEVSQKTATSDENKDKELSDLSAEDFEDTATAKVPEQSDKSEVGVSVLTILTDLLDSDSSDIRTVCAEGFARLMFAGRIISPSLFSRLLLHWYNPVTEDDTRLRQCLGTFFPQYAFASRANQEVVAEAFMPTLKALFAAPGTSPLIEVKVIKVAELLVQLSNARHQRSAAATDSTVLQDRCFHDDIAIKVANEILSEPDGVDVPVLVKVLSMLEITETNESNLKDLKVLGERMLKEVRDKQSSKALEKFQRLVKDLLHGRKRDTESKSEKTVEDAPMEEDDEKEEDAEEEEEKVAEEEEEAGEKEGKEELSKPEETVNKETRSEGAAVGPQKRRAKPQLEMTLTPSTYSLRRRQVTNSVQSKGAYRGSSNDEASSENSSVTADISFDLDKESGKETSESDAFQSPVVGKRKMRPRVKRTK